MKFHFDILDFCFVVSFFVVLVFGGASFLGNFSLTPSSYSQNASVSSGINNQAPSGASPSSSTNIAKPASDETNKTVPSVSLFSRVRNTVLGWFGKGEESQVIPEVTSALPNGQGEQNRQAKKQGVALASVKDTECIQKDISLGRDKPTYFDGTTCVAFPAGWPDAINYEGQPAVPNGYQAKTPYQVANEEKQCQVEVLANANTCIPSKWIADSEYPWQSSCSTYYKSVGSSCNGYLGSGIYGNPPISCNLQLPYGEYTENPAKACYIDKGICQRISPENEYSTYCKLAPCDTDKDKDGYVSCPNKNVLVSSQNDLILEGSGTEFVKTGGVDENNQPQGYTKNIPTTFVEDCDDNDSNLNVNCKLVSQCVKISGNGPRKVVFMRGTSWNANDNEYLAQVSDTINNGFKKVDPFKGYQDQFSFYIDLNKSDESASDTGKKINNVLEIDNLLKSTSSCGDDAFEYVLFSGRASSVNNGGAEFGNVWNGSNLARVFFGATVPPPSEDIITTTVIHESGHAVGRLEDEYVKLGTMKGSFIVPTNCSTNPKIDYTYDNGDGLRWYGSPKSPGTSGCTYAMTILEVLNYRPSAQSIMNSLSSPQQFNVISCGYLISAIKGEPVDKAHAQKYWPECMTLDTVKSGIPSVVSVPTVNSIKTTPKKISLNSSSSTFARLLDGAKSALLAGVGAANNISLTAGDTIAVSGSGFTATNNAAQLVDAANPSNIYDIDDISSSDKLAISFDVPTTIPAGSYYLKVGAFNSDWTSTLATLSIAEYKVSISLQPIPLNPPRNTIFVGKGMTLGKFTAAPEGEPISVKNLHFKADITRGGLFNFVRGSLNDISDIGLYDNKNALIAKGAIDPTGILFKDSFAISSTTDYTIRATLGYRFKQNQTITLSTDFKDGVTFVGTQSNKAILAPTTALILSKMTVGVSVPAPNVNSVKTTPRQTSFNSSSSTLARFFDSIKSTLLAGIGAANNISLTAGDTVTISGSGFTQTNNAAQLVDTTNPSNIYDIADISSSDLLTISFDVPITTPAGSYYLKVSAFNSGWTPVLATLSVSAPVVVSPSTLPPPTNLNLNFQCQTNRAISATPYHESNFLTWTSATDVDGYNVYRSKWNQGDFVKVASVTEPAWRDGPYLQSSNYLSFDAYYKVVSYKGENESSASNIVFQEGYADDCPGVEPPPTQNSDLTPTPNTPTISDGEANASYLGSVDKLTYFIPGKKANIDGAVLNLGPGAVSAGKHFNVRFQRSETQTFDRTSVGVVDMVAPAGNLLKSGNLSVSYTYLSSANDEGKVYFFRYCIDMPPYDYVGNVNEKQSVYTDINNNADKTAGIGEYNNCSNGAEIRFKSNLPDLTPLGARGAEPGPNAPVADSVNPNGTYVIGGQIGFKVQPKNIGAETTESFNLKLQKKLHDDSSMSPRHPDSEYADTGDTTRVLGGLAGRASVDQVIDYTSLLSDTYPKGYDFRFCIDLPKTNLTDPIIEGNILESNENNNCSGPLTPPVRFSTAVAVKLEVRKAGVSVYTHGPLTVDDADSVDLKWSSNGAVECNAGWTASKATAGTETSVGPLQNSSSPYIYSINCGGVSDSVTVNVNRPVVPPGLTCDLQVRLVGGVFGTNVTTDENSSIELKWSVTGATSVSLFKMVLDIPDGTDLAGNRYVGNIVLGHPLSLGQYTYKIIGTGNSGITCGHEVRITIDHAPLPDLKPSDTPTVTDIANPGQFIFGDEIKLSAKPKNQGGSAAGPFNVKFQYKIKDQDETSYANFPRNYYVSVPSGLGTNMVLNPPAEITQYINGVSDTSYDFRYCADLPPDNGVGQVRESDEMNNCSGSTTVTFTTGGSPPLVCPPSCPPLQVSCSVSPNLVDINSNPNPSVTWTAEPSGGLPPYGYLWAGNDSTLAGQKTKEVTFVYDPAVTERNFKTGSVTVTDTLNNIASPGTGCSSGVLVSNSSDGFGLSVGPVATINFVGNSAVSSRVFVKVNASWFNSPVTISAFGSVGGVPVEYIFYQHSTLDKISTISPGDYSVGLDMVIKANQFIPEGSYPDAVTVRGVGGGKSDGKLVKVIVNDSRPVFQNF